MTGTKKQRELSWHVGVDKNGFLLAVMATVAKRLRRKSGRISDENFGLFPKDGLLNERFLGLITTEDYAGIMND